MDVNLQKKRLVDIIDDFTLLENIPNQKIYKLIYKKLINLSLLVAHEKRDKYPDQPKTIDPDKGIVRYSYPDVCPTCKRKHYSNSSSEDIMNADDNRKSIQKKSRRTSKRNPK